MARPPHTSIFCSQRMSTASTRRQPTPAISHSRGSITAVNCAVKPPNCQGALVCASREKLRAGSAVKAKYCARRISPQVRSNRRGVIQPALGRRRVVRMIFHRGSSSIEIAMTSPKYAP